MCQLVLVLENLSLLCDVQICSNLRCLRGPVRLRFALVELHFVFARVPVFDDDLFVALETEKSGIEEFGCWVEVLERLLEELGFWLSFLLLDTLVEIVFEVVDSVDKLGEELHSILVLLLGAFVRL
ncbi:hypothetical protein M569_17710 [Genlisea aurea]|uniref:Uncharacterized protein n=1 Tax=Genlisea aurea TaxID=192259 RepID=S8BRS6_9LAMI|nr:hypothetical protein M569_17710 [Genlisea aurea]